MRRTLMLKRPLRFLWVCFISTPPSSSHFDFKTIHPGRRERRPEPSNDVNVNPSGSFIIQSSTRSSPFVDSLVASTSHVSIASLYEIASNIIPHYATTMEFERRRPYVPRSVPDGISIEASARWAIFNVGYGSHTFCS